MCLQGILNVIGSNASQNTVVYFQIKTFCSSLLNIVIGGREQVSIEESFLQFCSFKCANTWGEHKLLLCTCKTLYALSRLLSSGRSPYLFLRLIYQLGIFLLCLLPVWKELSMKSCQQKPQLLEESSTVLIRSNKRMKSSFCWSKAECTFAQSTCLNRKLLQMSNRALYFKYVPT